MYVLLHKYRPIINVMLIDITGYCFQPDLLLALIHVAGTPMLSSSSIYNVKIRLALNSDKIVLFKFFILAL